MKIAYLSTFYPYRGGIAQFNALLTKSLLKFAVVQPFTFKRQYPRIFFPGTTQFVEGNDKAEPINAIQVLDTINPFTYWTTAKKIKMYNPELILTKFWMPFFAPSLGSVLGFLPNQIVKISILDNIEPHEKQLGSRALIKYFLNRNDGFIVMSQEVGKQLEMFLQKPNMLYLLHPLYTHFGDKVDYLKAREKLNLPLDKKILLFFGFIRNYKGLDILLRAVSKLDNSYHLVVAGECYSSFDKYLKLINELGIQNKVSLYVRYISDNEVPLFFSAGDVCLLPYKSATQSGIIGISYHFNLPIIATDVGGLKEMIEPFGAGIVVKHSNPNLLRSAIEEYFKTDRKIYLLGIQRYKEIANWDYFSNKILEFYNTLRQSKRASDNIV